MEVFITQWHIKELGHISNRTSAGSTLLINNMLYGKHTNLLLLLINMISHENCVQLWKQLTSSSNFGSRPLGGRLEVINPVVNCGGLPNVHSDPRLLLAIAVAPTQ